MSSGSGETFPVLNPSDGTEIVALPEMSGAEAKVAIAAADLAFSVMAKNASR